MELPFFDSVEHFDVPQVPRKYTFGTISIDPTGSSRGGPCYSGSPSGISLTLLAEYQTLTIGMRLRYPTAFQGSTPITYGSNQGQAVPVPIEIRILNDGRIQLIDVTGGVWSIPGNNRILSGFVARLAAWYFVEYKMQLGTTTVGPTGHPTFSWEVRVNDNVIGTGVETSTNTNAGLSFPDTGPTFATFTLGPGSIYIHDIYVSSGEFLNEGKCRAFFGRLDGTYTAGVPSSPGAHYLMIKEHIADDNATTLSLPTIGNKESRFMDVVSGYSTIKGAQFLWCAKKTLPGPASFKGLLKSGGSEVNTPEFFPSDVSFFYHRDSYRKSPHTGGSTDYTQPELNGQEVGEERIS